MRTWFALAAATMLVAGAGAASAQSSSSLFSPASFMATPSIVGKAAAGSRPSLSPFSSLTSARGFLPSFPSFIFPMTQRSASAPTVRLVTYPPPKKKQ